MSPPKRIFTRPLRACYLNLEARVVDSSRMLVEQRLSALGDIALVTIQSLDDAKFNPCDLLIVMANHIPEDEFTRWLESFKGRIQTQSHVWIPALIIADIDFNILREILLSVVKTNWYFDVLSSSHLDSLPIRVANLLRIHDHLHELRRYGETLKELQEKVDGMEQKMLSPPA